MNTIEVQLYHLINDEGRTKFIIYPFGDYGRETKDILNNKFKIQELCIADNFWCEEYSDIRSVTEMHNIYDNNPDSIILLTISSGRLEFSSDVHQQIAFASLDRIVDLFNPSLFYNPSTFYSENFISKYNHIHTIECVEREIYQNKIEGSIAEAGVFRGLTAKYMNYLFPDRKLYLFDTFEGFKSVDQENDDTRGFYNEKIDFSTTCVRLVQQTLPFPQNVEIRKGWFPESAKGIVDKFAVVRLDMDLYDPIMAGLKFFFPLMSPGGYILVHDCRSPRFDGARKAIRKFCEDNHLNYVCMPDDGTAVISIGL